MSVSIAIVGTLDTKGAELGYLRDRIASSGASPILIDAGVMEDPAFAPDITADQVARAGGSSLVELRSRRDRSESMRCMSQGAAAVVTDLHQEGRLQGIVSLGGGQGSFIATAAMRALPLGVPKLMVSTIIGPASQSLTGTTDLTLMNSVVDIFGLNSIMRMIIENAAAAIVGMANVVRKTVESAPEFRVGITMFGVTMPCVAEVRRILESEGFEVLTFAATGMGDRAMEELVASGYIHGVVDITTSRVGQEEITGKNHAGPERLESASARGIPQVVTLGGLDIINCPTSDALGKSYIEQGRKYSLHSPMLASVRSSEEECKHVGEVMARKLNKAKGPVTVIFPRGGLSAYDNARGPLYDPAADHALFASLMHNLSKNVIIVESEHHINDKEFAAILANEFIKLTRLVPAGEKERSSTHRPTGL